MLTGWHTVSNLTDVDSPALHFYPARIAENIRRTLAIVGDAARLRPHIKTHKSSDVLAMQLAAGITKFKCATIAEAEMAAMAGVADVLLAYQPTGPRAQRFGLLMSAFPATQFSCIADNAATIDDLALLGHSIGMPIRVLLDIDCGQGRSGVKPDLPAIELYKQISANAALKAGGLHAYDGHIHDTDVGIRTLKCNDAFAAVLVLRHKLLATGLDVPVIVAGGTPTFPIHAQRHPRIPIECSPGTNILWDAGYATKCPDLDFLIAALVLTRVASKPGERRLCLDLGHKAIASEGPQPRVILPELTNCQVVMHNEEHLVVDADNGDAFKVGDALYGIPWHICPTVALHQEAAVVVDGRVEKRWKIDARDRRITV